MFSTAAGRTTMRFEYRAGSGDDAAWMESVKTPLFDADGKLTGIAGTARDITARKLAEGRMFESEQRFRSAFDHAATGMCMVARDGSWLRANQALCAMFGMKIGRAHV